MSDILKRENAGDRVFLNHYASGASNDFFRSQQSSDFGYSANGSTFQNGVKKPLTENASPAHPQGHLQSPSSQSPYGQPLTFTGHKDGSILHRGQNLINATAPRSNTGKLSGTFQYSGGILHSNADSNRLLQNFLTESEVSPLNSTTAKNLRHIEEDHLQTELGSSMPMTDPNERRQRGNKNERMYNQLVDKFTQKQAPNSNYQQPYGIRARQVSILPENNEEYSANFGAFPNQARHDRINSQGYQDKSSPLRMTQQLQRLEQFDRSGLSTDQSPYHDFQQLKNALLTKETKQSTIKTEPDWLLDARRESRDSQHNQEQQNLDQRLRKIQELAAQQTKNALRNASLPQTIIDDPSTHSQQPSMSSDKTNDRLETNSLIELETQIQRKKESIFKNIQNKCNSNQLTRNDEIRVELGRKKQALQNLQKPIETTQNRLQEAILGDGMCFYQDKLSSLRQKIQSIQNRQNAVSVNHSQLGSSHNHAINKSHVSNNSRVHFEPSNFNAINQSPMRTEFTGTRTQSAALSRNFVNQDIEQTQFLSVTQIQPGEQNASDMETEQPNIRDKVQTLKERLNGVVHKPPLNNEVHTSVLDIQPNRSGKLSAPTKFQSKSKFTQRSKTSTCVENETKSFLQPSQNATSLNSTQLTKHIQAPSEKQINLEISKKVSQSQCSLRKISRPRSAMQSQEVSIIQEKKAKNTLGIEQKTKDQQDRIRALITERKKNMAVVQDLQHQVESLHQKMNVADKKTNENAQRTSTKIKELFGEVENLQNVIAKYKKRATKLKKKLADEMQGTLRLKSKKFLSQTAEKPVKNFIEIIDERGFKTITTDQKPDKYVALVRKSFESQKSPEPQKRAPRKKVGYTQSAQLIPHTISISTRSVSPKAHFLKNIGQSDNALRRECCKRAMAVNSSSQSRSGSRSLSKTRQQKPTLQKTQSHNALQPPVMGTLQGRQQTLTTVNFQENKTEVSKPVSEATSQRKALNQRQKQPISQRKKKTDQRVIKMPDHKEEQIAVLQEQLNQQRIEANEWKQRSKNLAKTFIDTLRQLKQNLFEVREESQMEIESAKEHFESRIMQLEAMISREQTLPWRQNEIIQSTESVPKTLSPRIRNNNSRDSTHKKRKQTDEDSPVQKFMINQQSSNSNFHEADQLGVSEEQVLDRRMLEQNSNEEPDFA